MKILILLFTLFAIVCLCHSAFQCTGLYEVLDCVRDCPPEKTCRTKDLQVNCLQNNKRCQMKCVCENGFYRNINGDCVTKEMCDRCPGENEYYACGSECDNVCSMLHIQNQTNCPIVNIKCNEKCYCGKDFARNNNNVCVPIEKCSICGEHEEYQQCKKTCPPDTCVSLVAKFKCDSNPPCIPGCVCKTGFLRKTADALCKPMRTCQELANSPDFN